MKIFMSIFHSLIFIPEIKGIPISLRPTFSTAKISYPTDFRVGGQFFLNKISSLNILGFSWYRRNKSDFEAL